MWITFSMEQLLERMADEDEQSQDIPINLRLTKEFGLDDLFSKVAQEDFLLPRDQQRIRGTIEDCKNAKHPSTILACSCYINMHASINLGYRGSVEDSDRRFLVQRQRRLQRNKGSSAYAHSFTSLFLESAVQLMEASEEFGKDQVCQ